MSRPNLPTIEPRERREPVSVQLPAVRKGRVSIPAAVLVLWGWEENEVHDATHGRVTERTPYAWVRIPEGTEVNGVAVRGNLYLRKRWHWSNVDTPEERRVQSWDATGQHLNRVQGWESVPDGVRRALVTWAEEAAEREITPERYAEACAWRLWENARSEEDKAVDNLRAVAAHLDKAAALDAEREAMARKGVA